MFTHYIILSNVSLINHVVKTVAGSSLSFTAAVVDSGLGLRAAVPPCPPLAWPKDMSKSWAVNFFCHFHLSLAVVYSLIKTFYYFIVVTTHSRFGSFSCLESRQRSLLINMLKLQKQMMSYRISQLNFSVENGTIFYQKS
jgi:hypothetical protein